MKLYNIRGGNIKDLGDKRYTIGVGISLGNKWFTVENIIELVKWSLSYSKDKVIVYVADSIHAINLEVRSRRSYEYSLKKTLTQGDQVLNDIKKKIESSFSVEEKSRVIYVKWNELVDEKYKQKVKFLKFLYEDNLNFQGAIHTLVKSFTSKEERVFSEDNIHRLGDYVIEEFPEIINRVSMREIVCDAYVYPFDGELPELTEKIQKGEIFPEIKKNVMDTEPKVFLEVR